MTLLVTGGAGYIGSQTVRLLRARGWPVVVLDRLDRGNTAAVPGTAVVVGDCRDEELVRQVIERHDVSGVIHFAAGKSVDDSIRDPLRYFENNVGGSLAVVRAMATMGVRHLVFSSSCAVYGTPDEVPVAEDAPVRPDSPYGRSKRMVEEMLEWLAVAGQLGSVSLRYFNAAGADASGDFGEDLTGAANLVPVVLACALGRTPAVRVFGTDYPTPDGTAVRDYVHVMDVAEAHVRALELLSRPDEEGSHSPRHMIVNIGTGTGTSVAELISVARRVTGQPIPSEPAPRRPGDIPAIWAATERAERLLGWRARFGIEDIVASSWRWHRGHPTGLPRAWATR